MSMDVSPPSEIRGGLRVCKVVEQEEGFDEERVLLVLATGDDGCDGHVGRDEWWRCGRENGSRSASCRHARTTGHSSSSIRCRCCRRPAAHRDASLLAHLSTSRPSYGRRRRRLPATVLPRMSPNKVFILLRFGRRPPPLPYFEENISQEQKKTENEIVE